jgi:hypothetical protein
MSSIWRNKLVTLEKQRNRKFSLKFQYFIFKSWRRLRLQSRNLLWYHLLLKRLRLQSRQWRRLQSLQWSRVYEGDFSILARRCQLFSHRRRRSSRSGWLDLPPPREVAYLLFPLKEMDFPNLEIGLSVLIIMERLWFRRRTKTIGMVYPLIGGIGWFFWGGLGYSRRNGGRFFAREDDSTPKVKRQEGATGSAKLHKLWRRLSLL